MKIKILTFIFSLVVGFTTALQAQDLPKKPNPAKHVNDFAGFMSAEEVKTLEQKLYKYADTTSTQIVIVTISSLKGVTIEKYANDLARAWDIGQKDKNNGLLILIAKQERKMRIEVGYGLEGKVPDQLTAQIQDQQMRPNFKNNQYYKGLDEATDVLFDALKGEFKGTTTKVSQGQHDDTEIFIWVAGFIVLVIIIIIVGIWLSNISEKNNKRNNRKIGGSYSDYSDSSSNTTVIWGGGTSSYSDSSYSDTSSYSDSSYSDSSFGGGDFGGGGSSSDW